MSEKLKSPHWDERQHTTRRVRPVGDTFFDEGWPTFDQTIEFSIITWNGQKLIARVDLSTQYQADGIKWRTATGARFAKSEVIAWCEN